MVCEVGASLATPRCMARKKTSKPTRAKDPRRKTAHTGVVLDAVGGAVAGAAVGAVAGPAGAVAGGVLGTAIGALAGVVLERQLAERARHDQQLDRDIGVSEGAIGAASPDAPPATRGTFSAASSGFSSGGGTVPSEGPMQDLDSDS